MKIILFTILTLYGTYEGKWIFFNNRFVTALDLIRCLKQVEYQRFLIIYATISELPSI